MGLLNRQPERSRDMAKMLQSAEANGEMQPTEVAEQFGRRPSVRREDDDAILCNEHFALMGYFDRLIDETSADLERLRQFKDQLTEALRDRVIGFTAAVQREKAVIADLQGALQDMHERMNGRRVVDVAPVPADTSETV